MLVKIGKVYESQNGKKFEIIGLSDYHEFIGTSKDVGTPVYFDNYGTPVDLMTGEREPNNPLTLVKELTLPNQP